MKIICSTVVRAAKQGDIHGGLYVIDIDSGEVIHHAPYERDFVNDNERGGERGLRGICVLPDRILVADSAGFTELDKNTYKIKRSHSNRDYFKSIHEICFNDGFLWVTSTAHDAVAKLDLDFNVIDFWQLEGEDLEHSKRLIGKQSISAEEKTEDDKYHINSLFVNDNKVLVSGLSTPLYEIDTMKEACKIPTLKAHGYSVHSFIHNFYKYDDLTIANLTSFQAIGISKNNSDFNVYQIPKTKNVTYHVDSIASSDWNRGLARKDNLLLIGSSPARIVIYDLETNKFIKQIQLEKDIRHAIHGLEILDEV